MSIGLSIMPFRGEEVDELELEKREVARRCLKRKTRVALVACVGRNQQCIIVGTIHIFERLVLYRKIG